MEEKKLVRSQVNKMICGVCGGIGEYLNIDPTIIRLLCLLLVCGVGSGLLIYIVAAVIIPEEPKHF